MDQIFTNGPYGPLMHREGTLSLPFGESLVYRRRGDRLEYERADEEGSILEGSKNVIISGEEMHHIPTLPDLPVVLRMDHPLVIGPRNEISTVVPIPLIPALAVPEPKGHYRILALFPLPHLSKTWFGDPESGERNRPTPCPLPSPRRAPPIPPIRPLPSAP